MSSDGRFIASVLVGLPTSKPPPKEEIGWLDLFTGEAMDKVDREVNAKSNRRALALSLWGVTIMSGLLALFLGIGLFAE